MQYFTVSPDVPFGLGTGATFNQDPASWLHGVKPILNAEIVLYALPIPDFTTITPLYFATPALAEALAPLSGLRARSFSLRFDEQMEELGEFDGKALPELVCFEITGSVGTDDFTHVEGVPGLIVSERGLEVLRRFNLGIARVAPYAA